MTYTEALLKFTVVSIIFTMIPGIDFTFMLRAAILQPRKLALVAAIGVQIGIFAWAMIAVTGMQTLITFHPIVFDMLKIVGIVYMFYIGCNFFLASYPNWKEKTIYPIIYKITRNKKYIANKTNIKSNNDFALESRENNTENKNMYLISSGSYLKSSATKISKKQYIKHFTQGFLCDMLNPKVGFTFLLIFPNFMAKGVNKIFMGASLGIIHMFFGILSFFLMVICTNYLRKYFMSEKYAKLVDRISGVIIIILTFCFIYEQTV